MSEQLMTPAEIERAVKKQCAAMATEWGNARLDDHGGHACRNLADALRALPPMFGDVPADIDVVQLAKQAWEETGEGWTATAWFDSRAKSFERFAELLLAAAPTAGEAAAKDAEVATHPMRLILDARRRRFLELNGYELKYLPVYADQPDPTYIEKWVWEVRDEHGAAVAEAHEWLYAAIDAAMAAAPEVK